MGNPLRQAQDRLRRAQGRTDGTDRLGSPGAWIPVSSTRMTEGAAGAGGSGQPDGGVDHGRARFSAYRTARRRRHRQGRRRGRVLTRRRRRGGARPYRGPSRARCRRGACSTRTARGHRRPRRRLTWRRARRPGRLPGSLWASRTSSTCAGCRPACAGPVGSRSSRRTRRAWPGCERRAPSSWARPHMPVGGKIPPTRNPWNLEHTAGGTSSGSGAAVGARMVPVAIGEQTAGSNMRPAAYCGVAGIKPSYGRTQTLRVHAVLLVARPRRHHWAERG